MISYLATVSVSVVVLGPEKEDKDFTTWDKILKWSKVSSTLSGTQLVYREEKKPGLKAERRWTTELIQVHNDLSFMCSI